MNKFLLALLLLSSTASAVNRIADRDIASNAAIQRSKTASGSAYRMVVNNASGVMVDNSSIASLMGICSDSNGLPTACAATATEIGYLSGVSSGLQAQLNGKQSLDATLTALAAFNSNGLLTQTAPDTFAARSIANGSSKVSVTNGSGVSGNPTIDVVESNFSTFTGDSGSGGVKGVVPAPAAGDAAAKKYLGADGGWSTPAGGGGGSGGINFVALDTSFGQTKSVNQDLEASVGDWAAYADAAGTSPVDMTGGSPGVTCTRTTTSGEYLNGTASLKLSKGAANRQGQGCSVVANVPPGYRGTTATIEFPFKVITGSVSSGDIKVFAYDVTNSLIFDPVVSLTGSSGIVRFNIPVGSSTAQYRFGFHVATTSTSALDISFDDIYFGSNRNVANVSQAEVYGTLSIASCTPDWSTTSTSYVDFGTSTSCVYTATGGVSAPSTMLPAVRLQNAPPGVYVISAIGNLGRNGSGNYRVYARISDGSTAGVARAECSGGVDGAGLTACPFNISSPFTETSGVSDKTYRLQGMQDNASTAYVSSNQSSTQYAGLNFVVYRYPLDTQKVIKPDQTNTPATDFVPNAYQGWSSVTVNRCQYALQDEYMYIECTLTPGAVSASELRIGLPSGFTTSSSYTTRQIVGSGVDDHADRGFWPMAEASKTYLVFSKLNSAVSGYQKANGDAWSAAETKSFTAKVKIDGRVVSMSAPLLLNSVISDYSGVTKICTGYITNTGTPTVSRSSGNCIASLTDNGTGDTTVTFATGTFGSTPVCTANTYDSAQWLARFDTTTPASASLVRVVTFANGGANADAGFFLSCIGPK